MCPCTVLCFIALRQAVIFAEMETLGDVVEASSQDPPSSSPLVLGLQACIAVFSFYMGDGDPISGLHACTVRFLTH